MMVLALHLVFLGLRDRGGVCLCWCFVAHMAGVVLLLDDLDLDLFIVFIVKFMLQEVLFVF